MLYVAENGTASDVEALVRAYRRASRGEDLEEARRHREERYLDMYPDEDGMVVIRGRLPKEVAAMVEKALEAAMDALREEKKEEGHGDGDSAVSSTPSVIPAEAGIPQLQIDVGPADDSAESCRRLACDAPHVTVVQDSEGNALHMGRRARRISKPLWRALMSRDESGQSYPSMPVMPRAATCIMPSPGLCRVAD